MTSKTCWENIVAGLKIAPILLLVTTGLIPPAHGQSAPAVETDTTRSGAGSIVRFSLEMNSHAGTFTYVPGQWGELHLQLENGEETAQDLLCTTYINKDSTQQFARQVWLPPKSRLKISHPILFPDAGQLSDRSVSVRSLVIEASPGKEVLIRNDSGQLQHDRSLLITPPGRNTGVIAGWKSSETVPQDVLDLIVADRVYQGLDNKVTVLADQFLPADETSLHYVDHLILAENRLIDDFAALTAIRRWLHAGGRLWIMLDRTDPVILERLLGDEFQGSVADRVELTSVRVDTPPSVFVPEGSIGKPFEFDEPVNMAQLVASDMNVWHTVNGWPASLTRTYGRGRVLITTLGARGWMEPSRVQEVPNAETQPPVAKSDFMPLSPMEDLAAWILAERETDALPEEAMESFSREFVTYKVPGGILIIGTMGVFLVVLVVTGIQLWRWERLEHFGWIGSVLAICFGLVFTGIGVANRYGVSETIASVYFARAISGTDDMRASGVMAVYRPGGGQSLIQSSRGGELHPNLSAADGSTCRMVTTDLGVFRWDGLSQPAGLGLYPAETSRSLIDRITARATIDAQGLTGVYQGPSFAQADAIVATRQGRIGVRMASDGQFTAGAGDVLNADQYLNATLLNDNQDRRRRILQQLFENRNWQDSLEHPQVMLWLNDWDHGFQFGEDLQRQGDTLLMVPLELKRPPTGTELTIPSPLLNFTGCQPPDGSSAAGFWDNSRREWQERTRPSTTWLNIQIPRELLPLQASQAKIQVAVSGLMGQIEILGVKDGTIVSLETIMNPVGTMDFEINDAAVLAVSKNGELTLGVRGGIPAQASSAAADSGDSPESDISSNSIASSDPWKVESLSVQLQARTTEVSEED